MVPNVSMSRFYLDLHEIEVLHRCHSKSMHYSLRNVRNMFKKGHIWECYSVFVPYSGPITKVNGRDTSLLEICSVVFE